MNSTTTVHAPHRPIVLSGITPYAGTFGRAELIHLLKRTMFGAKKADIDFFAGKTLVQVVNTLLTTPTNVTPTLPVNNYDNAAAVPPQIDVAAPAGTTWVNANEDNNFNGGRRNSMRSWWGGQMINQDRSVFEKMVIFWHNHFATENVDTTTLMFWNHLVLLRNSAMGNFKTLVKDVTYDVNMLRYLNGYVNNKTAPDENYARELMELFTLGKGPDSQYTEADVKAAAKILTGWRIRNDQELPVGSGKKPWQTYFNPAAHDTTSRTFSSFFGGKVIAAAGSTTALNTDANARKEIDELINMIFTKDEVSKFICRKLYTYFIYYEIDAATETNVITPLAEIFRQSNYDIKPVLKALLTSEHFFDAANKACLIKSPLDFTIGTIREFDIAIPTAAADYLTQYQAWNSVVGERNNGAAVQGQHIGNPPNVAGWPAYYQVPVFHEYWINTDSFPRRSRYADSFLATTGVALGNNKFMLIDVLKFTDSFGNDAGDPVKLIDGVLELLYRAPVSNKFKLYVKNILLSGQSSDYYWTDAWDAYKTNPTTMNTTTVKTRLTTLYRFIVSQPEYHLS
jgi:uncharacterized protein (DUF1800 family)